MSSYSNVLNIPDDWFECIDRTRFFEEIASASKELEISLEKYFDFKSESLDQIIYIMTEQWSMTFKAVFKIFKSIIRIKAAINLFESDFGDRFPLDDNNRLLLTPEILSVIFQNSTAEDLQIIKNSKKELLDSKLLQKWLGLEFDFMN